MVVRPFSGYLGLGSILSSAVAPGFGIYTTEQFGNQATFVISCMMDVISASLLGQGIGPVVGGAIAGAFQYSAMFYFCAGLLLLGCLLYFIITRLDKAKKQPG